MRWISLMVMVLCLPQLGEAQSQPGHDMGSWRGESRSRSSAIARHPGRVVQDQVTVVVERLDAEQAKDIFNADLLRHGVQPLFIMIHNGGAEPYRFEKARVDARYLPAATASRAAFQSWCAQGVRLLAWVVSAVPAIIFPALRRSFHRPTRNRDIQADFVREEIADAPVTPGGDLEGFLFVRPMPPNAAVRVALIHARTREPLVFEFQE